MEGVMESLYISVATIGMLGLVAVLLRLIGWKKCNVRGALPPGPRSILPILGHLPDLFVARKSLHRYFAGLAHKYGPIVHLRLGSVPVVIVSSPKHAKEFLRTHDKTFANRPTFGSYRFMGCRKEDMSATLLPYGDEWRQRRKLYSQQLLSARRLHEFQVDIISHEIHHLISHQLQPVGAALVNVNLTACFNSLLESIMCHIILGQRPSQVMDGSSSATSHSLSQLMREASTLLATPLISDFLPCLGFFMDYSVKASMKKWKCSYDAVMDHIVDERKQISIVDDDVKSPKDILDVFLLPENNLSRDVIQARMLVSSLTDIRSNIGRIFIHI